MAASTAQPAPPAPPPATVGAIMAKRVVTVGLDNTLAAVQMLFRDHQFHHLLVLDEQRRLAGVISDRDLLKALSPRLGTPNETDRDRATLNRHAHQIMSRHPVTVTRESSIEDAARRMLAARVSSLPVVAAAGDDTLVGIVTWKDLLRALLPAGTG